VTAATGGSEAVVVLCTAPAAGGDGRAGAHELAQQLVDERLCACVNVVPGVRSYFRWEGRTDVADELLLIVKTTRAAVPALTARLLALHPYAVPEVLEIPVAGGAPAYLAWLGANSAPPTQ
jgi:periplasmic divalent cation tolerance protein